MRVGGTRTDLADECERLEVCPCQFYPGLETGDDGCAGHYEGEPGEGGEALEEVRVVVPVGVAVDFERLEVRGGLECLEDGGAKGAVACPCACAEVGAVHDAFQCSVHHLGRC